MQRESHRREEKPVEGTYMRSKSLLVTPTIEQETISAKSAPYV